MPYSCGHLGFNSWMQRCSHREGQGQGWGVGRGGGLDSTDENLGDVWLIGSWGYSNYLSCEDVHVQYLTI